jgi:hypothetical protein
MSTRTSVARWHRYRIPPAIAFVVSSVGGSTRRRPTLAPQVRGTVAPRIVESLERRGWHTHRIGAAAYVHAPDGSIHLILGVWRRRSTPPGWAVRLGRASAGYRRRLERAAREQRWRRQSRDLVGRFSAVMPWTRWPTPRVYAFDPVGPSVADQVAALEAIDRRRWVAAFPPDAPELELRALDGDR